MIDASTQIRPADFDPFPRLIAIESVPVLCSQSRHLIARIGTYFRAYFSRKFHRSPGFIPQNYLKKC